MDMTMGGYAGRKLYSVMISDITPGLSGDGQHVVGAKVTIALTDPFADDRMGAEVALRVEIAGEMGEPVGLLQERILDNSFSFLARLSGFPVSELREARLASLLRLSDHP